MRHLLQQSATKIAAQGVRIWQPLHRLLTLRPRISIWPEARTLEARVHRRTRELTTAFEFSQEIAAQLELDRLLDSATARARALMQGTSAALCLLEQNNSMLFLAASAGETEAPPKLRQPVTRQLPARIIQHGATVVSETTCSGCRFLQASPGSRCVATPLRVGDTTLGALCVVRPASAPFAVEEQNAFALLGNASAVAIVNARLVERERSHARAVAAEQERARLAAELHDNLAQTLGYLNFKAERLSELLAASALSQEAKGRDAAQELAQMRGAMIKAYEDVRAALTGLNHPPPNPDALVAQLAQCVEELRAATGLPIDLVVNDDAAFRLPPTAQRQALHIVREALLNVWRHAHAQRARVTVDMVDGAASFSVSDDGCGFEPDAVDTSTHFGLDIMYARAARSGGRLIIHSQLGAGTRLSVVFPPAGTQAS